MFSLYPQNYLTFSFNSFDTLVSNFKAIPSDNPKLLNLDRAPLKKKLFFFSGQIVIKLLLEMLELPNFGYMNTSTV